MTPLRAPIVRTGNFVGRVRVREPMRETDGRCRVIPFPKPAPKRDASLWRVRTCQWIDGDPKGHSHEPGLMCGCEVEPGLPYCADHAKRAYVAARPIRERDISPETRNGTRIFDGAVAGGVSGDDFFAASRPGGAFDAEGICGE